MSSSKTWYVYLIECSDGSLYTGITVDLAARFAAHRDGRGARSMRMHAPVRMLAAEITREKIFHRLHDELPYAITVETASWQDRKDGSTRIEQTIFVEREGQRSIVLGKGGQTIKQISMEARREMTGIFERPIHLFLFVKVRENWGDDPDRYREMGLDFPRE